MPRHFGPQNMKNGYAAMGGNKRRPHYNLARGKRTVAESIAHARRIAANEAARAKSSSKKK